MGAAQVVEAMAIVEPPRFGAMRFFMLQLVIWLTYGVVHYAASIPAILPEEHFVIAISKAVRAITGLAVSSLLIVPLQWRRYSHRAALGVIAAVGAIAAGFAWMMLDRVVLVTLASVGRLTIAWERFPHGMDLDYVFVMIAWTAVCVGFMLFERSNAQREALLAQHVQMQRAQLSLLAAQLNPHFLFNALNTIRSLAAEDATKTRDVVSRLASFLRRVVDFDATTPVTLQQEVGLAHDFLSIEQARFESGLNVIYETDATLANILVPPLILQPLLENAIKHGEPESDGVRRVRLYSTMQDGAAILRVENSGTLGNRNSDGAGLKLTTSRLANYYGSRSAFELAADGTNGVVAQIRIAPPLERAPPSDRS